MLRRNTSHKTISPMTAKLRCITNNMPVSGNDRSPGNSSSKKTPRNIEQVHFQSNEREKKHPETRKPSTLLTKGANLILSPTYSPLGSQRKRHHTMKNLIANKENIQRPELTRKNVHKLTLPAAHIRLKKAISPKSSNVQLLNVRRVVDLGVTDENVFQTPSSDFRSDLTIPTTVLPSDRAPNNSLAKTQSSSHATLLLENENICDEISCEEHIQDKTINDIPSFEGFIQSGRNTTTSRRGRDASGIFFPRSTTLSQLDAEESHNHSAIVSRNVSELQLTRPTRHNIVTNDRYKTLNDTTQSSEFMMNDKVADLLM